MSRISYFQRFSQKENHATNNTLLVLRRFYEESPFKIENVLSSMLDEDCQIGLSFMQQIKGKSSIPDALVSQQALRIFFETKRGGDLDHDQIIRHIDTIADDRVEGQTNILIGLTKEPIAKDDVDELRAAGKKNSIIFTAVTFTQIVDALRNECADYERDLVAIVEDFKQYLSEEGLIEERNQWLPVFSCGVSYAENEKFGIYYEPPSRPCKRNYRFIGIYAQKRVTLIGEIETIAVGTLDDGELTFDTEVGTLNAKHKDLIREVIDTTGYYDLGADPTRYYLVKEFVSTDIEKASPGGIRGLRYLDLQQLVPDLDVTQDYSANEMAERLKGTQFE